ncbi:hypothetical protein C0585_08330 [Candidatus Woesearchaeota archaeon]|nr:MAG: hypothetical protein C0585_08330 [Candidatus Woesearchaeota archaeon]
MDIKDIDDWNPLQNGELNNLINETIEGLEEGGLEQNVSVGSLSSAKSIRNHTKDYLFAFLKAGSQQVTSAKHVTALGMVNAYRAMINEEPLDELSEDLDYKVINIQLGSVDEIYIQQGNKVLYGEKLDNNSVLLENFKKTEQYQLIKEMKALK